MNITKRIKEYIDIQYGRPAGLLGMYIGEKMVKQHEPETLWTVKLLNIKEDERILELGCGAGYALKILFQQYSVKYAAGLDLSKTVLRSAKIRNRKEIRNGKLKLVQNNVDSLDFCDNSFHKAFSIHSIYFWDNLPKAVSEIYRVLKPDGCIVITLCDGENMEIWDDTKNMIDQQLIPVMKQFGFKNLEILRGPDSREYLTLSIRAVK